MSAMDEESKDARIRVGMSQLSQVSWGAIFAGWLLANAIALLLFNFGSAVGLSTVDVSNPEQMAKGVAFGTASWVFITWAVSMFLGGLFSGWLAGKADAFAGALHGMAVWALSLVFALFVGMSGLGAMAKTGQSIGQGLVQAGAQAAPAAADAAQSAGQQEQGGVIQGAVSNIQNQLQQQMAEAIQSTSGGQVTQQEARQTVEQIDPETMRGIAASLARGDAEGARSQLSQNTALEAGDVDRIVAGLSRQMEEAKSAVQQTAVKAADYSAAALWLVFFSNVIGMIVSFVGGRMGSNRIAHAYGIYSGRRHRD